MSEPTEEKRFVAKVDAEKCSLCEVCVNHCPNGAMLKEQEDKYFRLIFDSGICNGCETETSCSALCPEKAIELSELQGEPSRGVILESEMLYCETCKSYFAPERRLEKVAKRAETKAEEYKDSCPICRRTNLVIRFIEEKRAPGSKARYRRGKELMEKGRVKSKRKTAPPPSYLR